MRTAGLVISGEHQLPSSSYYFYIKELCRIWNFGSLTNTSFDAVKLMITIYPGELGSALVSGMQCGWIQLCRKPLFTPIN